MIEHHIHNSVSNTHRPPGATDLDGLYNADPRDNPDATLVAEAAAGDPSLEAMAGGGGALGRGGMLTKVRAAALAARSGTETLIAHGRTPDVMGRLVRGDTVGTRLRAARAPLAARKQWLAGLVKTSGTLLLDEGAVRVLSGSGRSLLPVGVKAVEGNFVRGDMVICADSEGREVARGLVNYNSDEARKIIGHPSDRIVDLLGYQGDPELIHRDNLVLNS